MVRKINNGMIEKNNVPPFDKVATKASCCTDCSPGGCLNIDQLAGPVNRCTDSVKASVTHHFIPVMMWIFFLVSNSREE